MDDEGLGQAFNEITKKSKKDVNYYKNLLSLKKKNYTYELII